MPRRGRVNDPNRKYEPRVYPYWKIQFFVEKNFAWKDIQTAFHDKEEAIREAKALNKKRIRLMEIQSEKKRTPLPEIEQ